MKLSSVAALLNSQISAAQFSAEISDAIENYEQALQLRGGSVPIQLTEDTELFIAENHIGVLCLLFASDLLSVNELAYVADALELSEQVHFESDFVRSSISEMTDPEINGPFSKERAFELMAHAV